VSLIHFFFPPDMLRRLPHHVFAYRETILPNQCYKRVLDSIEEQNYLDVLADLEQKLRLEHDVTSLAMAWRRRRDAHRLYVFPSSFYPLTGRILTEWVIS